MRDGVKRGQEALTHRRTLFTAERSTLRVLAVGVSSDLQSRVKGELLHHVPDVTLDGMGGDVETRRDLLVAEPFADERDDFLLSRCHAHTFHGHRPAFGDGFSRDLREQRRGHLGW